MGETKPYNTKKIIGYSLVATFFGILSIVFYVLSDENIVEQEQTIVVIDYPDTEIKITNNKDIANDTSHVLSTIANTIHKQEVILTDQLNGKYFIIIGTFRDKENAINLSNQMHEKGHNSCQVIYNGVSLYWVSFNSYENLTNAKKDILNFNLDGWIKKI